MVSALATPLASALVTPLASVSATLLVSALVIRLESVCRRGWALESRPRAGSP